MPAKCPCTEVPATGALFAYYYPYPPHHQTHPTTLPPPPPPGLAAGACHTLQVGDIPQWEVISFLPGPLWGCTFIVHQLLRLLSSNYSCNIVLYLCNMPYSLHCIYLSLLTHTYLVYDKFSTLTQKLSS